MKREQTAPPLAEHWHSLAERCSRALVRLRRSWNGRRAMLRLNDLTDRELRDIGLTREDLRDAYHASVFRDPTERLQRVVQPTPDRGTALDRRP